MIDVHALSKVIDFEPTYQRQSDIWAIGKRQLFIDSLINGFDIPKLYFHDLDWDPNVPKERYAIIDGKQRLEAIQAFINNAFTLSDEFEDLHADVNASAAAGLSYSQLAADFPLLKGRFDHAELPIVLVQTKDYELVDELFSRLNEAVPLNAPEKRNALGGPLPGEIRRIVGHQFFSSRMAFPNSRYRHLDIATKFLYIEYRGGLVDLKKRDLDDFVREFKRDNRRTKATALYKQTVTTLNLMSRIFVPSDPLLGSVGMITVYYEMVRQASAGGWLGEVEREKLVRFEDERAQNRGLVKEAQELSLQGKTAKSSRRISAVLTQFERYVQSPNDIRALSYRLEVLTQFVRSKRIAAS